MHRIGSSTVSDDLSANSTGINNDSPSFSRNVETEPEDREAARLASLVVTKTKSPGRKTGVIPEIMSWAVCAIFGMQLFPYFAWCLT
jgi:hypothetical protein